MKLRLPQTMFATWFYKGSAPAHYNMQADRQYKLFVEERAPAKELEKSSKWLAVKIINDPSVAGEEIRELFYSTDRDLSNDWRDWFSEKGVPLLDDWWR